MNNTPTSTWNEIKAAYQRGEGSCRELAEKFNVSFAALRSRHAREKWVVTKKQFEAKVMQTTLQKIIVAIELSAEELLKEQKAHVQNTITRAKQLLTDLDVSRQTLFTTDEDGNVICTDQSKLESIVRSEARLNEMLRLSLGLPDKNLAPPELNANRGEPYVPQIGPETLEYLNDARKRWMERTRMHELENKG